MTAADAREELEAVLWHLLPEVGAVDAVLALADAYASAVADERIAGRVHDRTIGRERLADLDAAVRSRS